LLFSLIAFLIFYSCSPEEEKINKNLEFCYSNNNIQSIVNNANSREYVIYVPDSYDGVSSIPLMLNFHGFGDSASDFIRDTDMLAVAESNAFILAYPQGSCLDGISHWNACPNGGDNKSDADDFGFIELIINDISSKYNVDIERVYAVGYSNGGMMAYGLANYKSDLIAAVGSVSGAMLDCIGSTNHPMPVVHLHGTSDDVIPYDGGNGWNSTKNTLDHWINLNNTTIFPIVNTDNSGSVIIEHFVYDQGNNSVSVENYKYIGGEHVWFNATFQGQNTSELIWNFMSRYDIKGLR
jgi:polyhydroxybutyrate depolymerase